MSTVYIRNFVSIFYLCRHSDSKAALKDSKNFSAAEDDMSDVYPLQLRLSVLKETNSLSVRISKKVSLTNLSCPVDMCAVYGVTSNHL